jgi:hypothetical protein
VFRFRVVPESVCKDWMLPALPSRGSRTDWPLNSVTFWSLGDATPLKGAGGRGAGAAVTPSAILEAPERRGNAAVTVIGRFRGANLFGDLPETTRREASDWVIADDGAALWVTGKAPRGRGWNLALDSKDESRWWIEVTGRLEVRGGVAYLRARELTLRRSPPSTSEPD